MRASAVTTRSDDPPDSVKTTPSNRSGAAVPESNSGSSSRYTSASCAATPGRRSAAGSPCDHRRRRRARAPSSVEKGGDGRLEPRAVELARGRARQRWRQWARSGHGSPSRANAAATRGGVGSATQPGAAASASARTSTKGAVVDDDAGDTAAAGAGGDALEAFEANARAAQLADQVDAAEPPEDAVGTDRAAVAHPHGAVIAVTAGAGEQPAASAAVRKFAAGAAPGGAQ